MGTKSAQCVGLFFLAFASLAFILVIVRDGYHTYMCVLGLANWGDPILLVDSSCHPSRQPRNQRAKLFTQILAQPNETVN